MCEMCGVSVCVVLEYVNMCGGVYGVWCWCVKCMQGVCEVSVTMFVKGTWCVCEV